ncbi:MAG: hypothetical protein RR087_04250 [Oscillospiraceae bacterium]
MTDLEKIRKWLATYPKFDILGKLQVDYVDKVATISSLAPNGLEEIEGKEDILGNTTITNQYNFALYAVFEKPPDDDTRATYNADWVMDFQKWVQEQSAKKLVPLFGNTEEKETAKAQNGMLIEQEDEGIAVYIVQLSITYKTFYGGE